MPKCPDNFKEQINDILIIKDKGLTTNAKKVRNLFEQVVSLADGMYQPYYQL